MRWTRDVNGGSNNIGTRAFDTDGSRVIFGISPDAEVDEVPDDDGASFHAYDFGSGDELWTVEAPSNGKHTYAQGVAIVGDVVVDSHGYAEGEPLVYGVDLESGETQWAVGVPDLPAGYISDVFGYDDEAYVTLGRGTRVLDPQTGSVSASRESIRVAWPGGSVSGDTLFAPSGNDLIAYDLENGGERWSQSIGDWIDPQPAVDNSLVVAGTRAGNVHAFERASGEQRWKYSIDRAVGALALSVSLVWVADNESGLTAHRRSDGEVIDRSTHDVEDIAVHDNTLLVGGNDTAAYLFDTN